MIVPGRDRGQANDEPERLWSLLDLCCPQLYAPSSDERTQVGGTTTEPGLLVFLGQGKFQNS